MIDVGVLRAFLVAASVAFVVGCGASAEQRTIFPCHVVKGVVLVEGKPAGGAKIVLYPVSPEINEELRPSATAGADGSFTITSYKEGDGAPVGEYGVSIIWPPATPAKWNGGMQGEGEAKGDADRLFGRYLDPGATKLRRSVAAGENAWRPFDLSAQNLRPRDNRTEGE